jgi:Fe-S cluster assembly ATP-binding protein
MKQPDARRKPSCRDLKKTTGSDMLKIENLHVRVAGKDILKGLDLQVKAGEVHAIMGPNGAGKSTLGNVLAGRAGYEVSAGSIHFEGGNLLELEPEERAAAGVFLAFQYPVEIPGVNNTYFLRAALNAQRKRRGEAELDSMQFLKRVREKLAVLHLKDELLHRAVNEGFSGGEKKRNEIFQMALLEPKLAILDETDSGLDIDALKMVADGVNAMRDPARTFVVITHYQRLSITSCRISCTCWPTGALSRRRQVAGAEARGQLFVVAERWPGPPDGYRFLEPLIAEVRRWPATRRAGWRGCVPTHWRNCDGMPARSEAGNTPACAPFPSVPISAATAMPRRDRSMPACWPCPVSTARAWSSSMARSAPISRASSRSMDCNCTRSRRCWKAMRIPCKVPCHARSTMPRMSSRA